MYVYVLAAMVFIVYLTFICIHYILSLVCVSDLPTHYVHVMASCGDHVALVFQCCVVVGVALVFLGTSLWVCILQRSGEKGECVYTCVCGGKG